jgi:hypothetical protein
MRYAKRCITIGVALFVIVGLRVGTGPAQKAYVIKLGHNDKDCIRS